MSELPPITLPPPGHVKFCDVFKLKGSVAQVAESFKSRPSIRWHGIPAGERQKLQSTEDAIRAGASEVMALACKALTDWGRTMEWAWMAVPRPEMSHADLLQRLREIRTRAKAMAINDHAEIAKARGELLNLSIYIDLAIGGHRSNRKYSFRSTTEAIDKKVQDVCVALPPSWRSLDSFLGIIDASECYEPISQNYVVERKTPKQDAEAVTHSPVEAMLYEAVAKLPGQPIRLTPQFKRQRCRHDFLITGTKIIVEVDGHNYHSTKKQRAADAERDREAMLDGYTTIRFTGSEVYHAPVKCAEKLLSIVEATCGIPRLPGAEPIEQPVWYAQAQARLDEISERGFGSDRYGRPVTDL